MTKAEMIKKVDESMGSLFTKEDVIFIINQIEENQNQSKIDFEELTNRIESIIDDADTSDIEINSRRCTFEINNGNEIAIEDVEYDVDSYVSNIKHEIGELIEAAQRGEACQSEEEVEA